MTVAGEKARGPWPELLRALGEVADSPAGAAAACPALGLPVPSAAEHTEVFVLNCPPYESVYLGAEGGLGGEAAGRVAGFWQALGIAPPAEPDHLAALLSLYASLGEAAGEAGRPATAGAFTRARRALLTEHLWPWLPAYLDAVASLGTPALAGWAALVTEVLAAEMRESGQEAPLPLALRAAPAPPEAGCPLDELLDVLTTPVRSGMILTRRRLAEGAGEAGAGHRIGERRFTLRAMLEQEPERTLGWLAGEARWWQRHHAARAPGDPVQDWWARRAGHTGGLLTAAVAAVAGTGAAR